MFNKVNCSAKHRKVTVLRKHRKVTIFKKTPKSVNFMKNCQNPNCSLTEMSGLLIDLESGNPVCHCLVSLVVSSGVTSGVPTCQMF